MEINQDPGPPSPLLDKVLARCDLCDSLSEVGVGFKFFQANFRNLMKISSDFD